MPFVYMHVIAAPSPELDSPTWSQRHLVTAPPDHSPTWSQRHIVTAPPGHTTSSAFLEKPHLFCKFAALRTSP